MRIATIDNESYPLSGGRARRMRDETLDPMTSGQTISRGKYWDGTGVNPKLDEKTAVVRDFVRGFVPGNIVDAVDPGQVISLGKVFSPHAEEGERESLTRAIDDLEQEWKRDERCASDEACDIPPHEKTEKTKDARSTVHHQQRLGSNRGLFTAQGYADNLRAARKAMAAQDQAASAPKARMSSAEFAALRVNKGR